MRIELLNYIWKHCNFSVKNLHLTNGEPLLVHHQGIANPAHCSEFIASKITIGSEQKIGRVQLETRSSEVDILPRLGVEKDNELILLVVWEYDAVLENKYESLPVLELKQWIKPDIIKKYEAIVNSVAIVPCSEVLPFVQPITKLGMVVQSAVNHLEKRGREVLRRLEENQQEWEETTYQLLVQKLDAAVNAACFKKLSHSLPYSIIKKHTKSIFQIEALLFGMAGFLEHSTDPYHDELKTEFTFLSNKYNLKPCLSVNQWKFLRLRPNNYPTLRIAQLAAMLSNQPHLFDAVVASKEIGNLEKIFRLKLSSYWETHYRFGEITKIRSSQLGLKMVENLKINFFVPVLVGYGLFLQDRTYVNRALVILEKLPPEQNKVTKTLELAGFNCKRAFDSQGLLEIYNEFCSKKKCLSCNIGVKLIS